MIVELSDVTFYFYLNNENKKEYIIFNNFKYYKYFYSGAKPINKNDLIVNGNYNFNKIVKYDNEEQKNDSYSYCPYFFNFNKSKLLYENNIKAPKSYQKCLEIQKGEKLKKYSIPEEYEENDKNSSKQKYEEIIQLEIFNVIY